MISTSLIKAAELTVQTVLSQQENEGEARRELADLGVGYHGSNAFIERLLDNVPLEDVATSLMYAFLVGIMSERLFGKLAHEDEAQVSEYVDAIKTAVIAYDEPAESSVVGVIEELGDMLYSRYDIVPDELTSREIVTTLLECINDDDDPYAKSMATHVESVLAQFNRKDDEGDLSDEDEGELSYEEFEAVLRREQRIEQDIDQQQKIKI